MRRVLVQLDVLDLEARQFAEDHFTAESRELVLDVDFLPSHELFFPGRSYSEAEIEAVLDENRIDAALVVGIAGEGGTAIYVPRSSTSITNRFGSSYVTRTTEHGGFLGVAPWAEFDMALADLTSGEVVWVATAKTQGRVSAIELQLLKSFVEQGVEKLRSDGFLTLAELPRHRTPSWREECGARSSRA